jgi:hypothetical protein
VSGEVWLAKWRGFQVAVKQFKDDPWGDANFQEEVNLIMRGELLLVCCD